MALHHQISLVAVANVHAVHSLGTAICGQQLRMSSADERFVRRGQIYDLRATVQ